jgi:NADPH:quinone reductase-like Zn-dependent oxidoreductase
MKAVVYDKSKSPDILVYREVEKPVPGDNEVLVRIHAAAVNAADSRSMKLGAIPKRKIFGCDIAGEVEAVGKNIRRFKAGDLVLGDIARSGMGGFAQYVAVPETPLALKPAAVPFETAAAVPLSAVTALQGLRDLGRIKPGIKALIYGAGGGVGTFAVQLAKHFGAEVTAVCGEKNVEVIRSLGADHVINYLDCDVTSIGGRYDLVLAVNGSNPLKAYLRLLAPGGICVMVGGSLKQVIKALVFGSLMSLGSRKMRSLNAKPNAEDLAFVIKLVEEGKLKPVIDRRYPLTQTAEAVRYQSEGHAMGKIIIEVA